MLFNRYLRKFVGKIYRLPYFEKPLPKNPFGKSILASKEKYLDLYNSALKKDDREITLFEKDCRYKIDMEWFNELALHTQVVLKKEELNFFHGRLLYSLLSKYIDEKKLEQSFEKPLFILETGTARGFSSICMSKALIDRNYPGVVNTLDCIPHNRKIFWNCLDDHEGPKSREELLSKWNKELRNIIFIQGWTNKILPRLSINRINFAFLDAQHTKEDVLREFRFVSQRQLPGDLVVFDDVTENLFPGVCEAIKYIEKDNSYKVEKLNFTQNRGYAIATKL